MDFTKGAVLTAFFIEFEAIYVLTVDSCGVIRFLLCDLVSPVGVVFHVFGG